MEKMTVYTGKPVILERDHVDTDQIIPKQFLKRIERTGFGRYVFFDWRFHADGTERDDFELNQPEAKGATILLAGENFGCGSSREHAPWALGDYGFKVILASSFADIFHQNCLQNGILPITLEKETLASLKEFIRKTPLDLTVDLPNQELRAQENVLARFDIHPYWKNMLINGWDEIELTLQYNEEINQYEQRILA
ncbi:3-isopropylmalate dehydratase small subunit [Pradoshia sp. D12]|uniref:3-isopropylmalate dehydratase small subunit n=1 Tax=Bacillaceae TaxID=186817 RepID=UPI00080AD9E1|nr:MULTISPECIES: 3-isopropylmalate dehydratase small subunit [Bacillaceae]OCA81739.1 3-isopropylmalate dehydratase small subunit [Bacillus sp. FJAT-27986]QFK72410.1 3-isopropylmalate dehydratase small subunit [Pradoshia sp. D12]TPF70846.1 3-isopropylmalate dehydratase small subunit [Bacillus sp. D12]